jgi:beta-lactam-binding protein with PASTA domain
MASGLLLAAATKNLSAGSVVNISQYINIKQPPTVIKQSPAPGTPVIQGMTIELSAVSLSDVPFAVVDAQAPNAVKNVSMADIQAVVEADSTLKAAVKNGVIPQADLNAIVQSLNTGLANKGLSGTISSADATELVQSINNIGFVNF